jgi:hypothetical protein
VYRAEYKRPFSVLKYAMTLDGKIAASTGHAAWVSGKESRQKVFAMRARSDAIIVGGNTVRRDSESVSVRTIKSSCIADVCSCDVGRGLGLCVYQWFNSRYVLSPFVDSPGDYCPGTLPLPGNDWSTTNSVTKPMTLMSLCYKCDCSCVAKPFEGSKAFFPTKIETTHCSSTHWRSCTQILV